MNHLIQTILTDPMTEGNTLGIIEFILVVASVIPTIYLATKAIETCFKIDSRLLSAAVAILLALIGAVLCCVFWRAIASA